MRWAKVHLSDWDYRTMRTKVFDVTGEFIAPADDTFKTLAKFAGPSGMDIDTYRMGREGVEATNASTSVVPGHTVTFWTATVAPPTGPRITNTAPPSGISALLATTTPSSAAVPIETPQKTAAVGESGAGGAGASATKSGYRRARPRTEPTVANTLLQYTTPSK